MNGNYILDTNAVINILKGLHPVFSNNAGTFSISVISEIEVLSFPDLTNDEDKKIRRLISETEVIPLDIEIKDMVISIRKKYHFKVPDAIILASAKIRRKILVTDDKTLYKYKDIHIIPLASL